MKAAIAVAAVLASCGEDPPEPPAEKQAPVFTALLDRYAPGALFSGWAGGPSDVWVVGGEVGKPVALHFDGEEWTRRDPPIPQQLWWVHGFPGGPVFVAGEGGAIARYEAGAWSVGTTTVTAGSGRLATSTTAYAGTTFYGIWGATPEDVWAVGGIFQSAPAGVQKTGDVVLRLVDGRWTRVRIAELEDKPVSAQKNLFKVWGAGPNAVFIVGDGGGTFHFDGQSWRKEDSGVPGQTLFTVAGRSAGDVWAIGGLGAPVLIHWDGRAWATVELPADAPQVMQGLWTAPGQPVIASGHQGFIGCLDAEGRWAVSEPATNEALHAVWGDGAGLWASGGNILSLLPDYVGTLLVSGRTVAPPAP